MRNFSIKEWAEDDQPRTKLKKKGAASLSNAELLAILIQNGSREQSALDLARELLQSTGNRLQELAMLEVSDILKKKIKGIGEAKAISIVAAMELGMRREASENKKEKIARSGDIADYLRAQLASRQREFFAVVFLNRGNKIRQLEIISEGGLTGTVADPRVILKKALEYNATSLILCHNHPGGSLQPSKADELVTQKIRQAAQVMDIYLMDHIIVSQEGHFSFADAGMLG
jgi:DNA repair protein RadC